MTLESGDKALGHIDITKRKPWTNKTNPDAAAHGDQNVAGQIGDNPLLI